MLLLSDLLKQISPISIVGNIPDQPVTGIQEDSRLIQVGNIFIARGGTKTDGSRYLDQAAARGAIAVVTASPVSGFALPQVIVADPARDASLLANAFFDQPSHHVKTIGITGTNGKTTTSYLLRHVLNHFNLRCGMMGTVEIDDGKDRYESSMTTPGPIEVAQLLAKMHDKGCRACAMETSSHALHQSRVAGVPIYRGNRSPISPAIISTTTRHDGKLCRRQGKAVCHRCIEDGGCRHQCRRSMVTTRMIRNTARARIMSVLASAKPPPIIAPATSPSFRQRALRFHASHARRPGTGFDAETGRPSQR